MRQPGAAAFVVPHLIQMLRSIDFNHQFRIKAGEVDHVAAQRMLPSKLHAQLLLAQSRPQLALGIGQGSQMLQRLAIAVIGGILAYMMRWQLAFPGKPIF